MSLGKTMKGIYPFFFLCTLFCRISLSLIKARTVAMEIQSHFLHCNNNHVYVFLFWELRGLVPKFYSHVSVGDLYIPRIRPHISCSRIGRSIVGIYKWLTDT
jgi:hypothetical protein